MRANVKGIISELTVSSRSMTTAIEKIQILAAEVECGRNLERGSCEKMMLTMIEQGFLSPEKVIRIIEEHVVNIHGE